MGGFYTNYTLRGPSQTAVAESLAGRCAMITPPRNGCVVAFDEESDNQDLNEIGNLAAGLSGKLQCSVLAVLNHDDDFLWYQLYSNGKLTDQYHSLPGYFDFGSTGGSTEPAGGNAQQLCAAFGAGDMAAVERILQAANLGEAGYAFAHERHADLVRALGIPEFAVGFAYASFEEGNYPEGVSANDLLRSEGPPPLSPDELRRRDDLAFYDRLGAEDRTRPCKRTGCDRGSVPFSVLCRRHHFEKVRMRECPFDH